MQITINIELVEPLQTAARNLGTLIQIEPFEGENGQILVLLPETWGWMHWFEFDRQSGIDFQFICNPQIRD